MIPQPGPHGRARSATIGRYQIRDRLGEGGMGVLYLALDPAIDRLLALKVLRADSVDFRERFIREAQFAARLQHPHIVTIYDVGTHEGQPFIAMEYIPGETLGELIRSRAPLAVSRRLMLMADVCQGLAYAHKRNVIHRDVKPANLMVSRETGTVKILDFGIARGGDSALTQAGVLVGTPNYMSPEQVLGEPLDHRSDIFAVGAVLHELLVYRRAFSDENAHTVLHKIVHTLHTPVAELNPNLPPAIQPILDRAMAKRAADRYPDLDLLRQDLIRLAQEVETDEAADTLAEPAGIHVPEPEKRSDSAASGSNKARLAERRAARVVMHVRAAEAALSAGHCEEALAEAELAEELDPDHPSVVTLMARVHTALTARELERALDEVRQHLETGALSAAGAALSRANKLAPGSPDVQALRRQLDHAVEERERDRARGQKADSAIAQARESLRVGVLDGALRAIVEALGHQPEREDALALRREIDDEIGRRVDNVVALADRDIAGGHVAAAIDRLERFAPRHPLIVEALDRARQESARKAEEQRQQKIVRDRAIDAVLAEARDLVAHDRIDTAIELLARVTPADARLLDAIGTLRDELATRERRRLSAEVQRAQAAIAHARGLYQASRAVEAFDELERFAPPHALVGEALATLRAEHVSRARDAIHDAEALVARDAVVDAIALLERFTPPTPDISDALIHLRTERAAREARQQVDQAARRWQDEELQRRSALDEWIARRLSDAENALNAGRFEDAIAIAQRALNRVPDCAPAARLLDTAVERQATRDAAAARDAKVQAHVQAARSQAETGDYAAALAHVGSAAEIAPADPAIAPLRAAIEQQRAAAEERARREAHDRRAADLVATARAQFALGHHQHALTRCERFTPPHPLVIEAYDQLSAQLAEIERERAETEQRAHDARLALLREEEERARLADTLAAAGDGDTLVTTSVADEAPSFATRAREQALALVADVRARAARKPMQTWAAVAMAVVVVMVGLAIVGRGLTFRQAQARDELPPSSSTSTPDTKGTTGSTTPKTGQAVTSDRTVVEPERLSTLLVDASPWARVVRISDAKGRAMGNAGAYTPVTLAVAAGTYTVTLERDGKRRTEQVTIGEREQRTARIAFEPVDTAEFFK